MFLFMRWGVKIQNTQSFSLKTVFFVSMKSNSCSLTLQSSCRLLCSVLSLFSMWTQILKNAQNSEWNLSRASDDGGGSTLALKQLTGSTRPLVNDMFVWCLRNRMALLPTQAFYLLINNSGLASMSLTMAQVYKDHQDDDGFLYMTYASQEMFGQWRDSLPTSDFIQC